MLNLVKTSVNIDKRYVFFTHNQDVRTYGNFCCCSYQNADMLYTLLFNRLQENTKKQIIIYLPIKGYNAKCQMYVLLVD
jgi:hypothetical protein